MATASGNLASIATLLAQSENLPLSIGLYADSSGKPGQLLETWSVSVPMFTHVEYLALAMWAARAAATEVVMPRLDAGRSGPPWREPFKLSTVGVISAKGHPRDFLVSAFAGLRPA